MAVIKASSPQRSRVPRNPQEGHSTPIAQAALDETISRAQEGRVNLTAAKAVEMASALYGQSRFAQAERVCRQIIAARPANGDAHNILGATLAAMGRLDEAESILRRATKLDPQAPSFRSNYGDILRRQGKLGDAADELNAATQLDPHNPLAWNNLGIVYFEKQDFSSAVHCYRRALELDSGIAEAHNNLGNALRSIGDHEGAFAAYEHALLNRTPYAEAYNNLGTLLHEEQRFEEAEHALRKAINQRPGYVEAHNNLARLLFARNNEVEALRILGEALKCAPNNADTLLLTARIQLHRNSFELAEQGARMVLDLEPQNSEAWIVLGQVLHETDRYDEAVNALEQALAHNPESPEGLNFYGVALKSVGRLEEAKTAILKAIDLGEEMYGAYANLNDLVDFSTVEGEALFDRIQAIFDGADDPRSERFTALHFAYAKALDDRGEHEKALGHFVTGGELKRAQLAYDETETHGFFDAIRESFPKEMFENRVFDGVDDRRFVFIVGMPRSGSTLVEQILATHPEIHGAGEVKHLARAIGDLRDRFPALPKFPELMSRLTAEQLDIMASSYRNAISEGAGDARRVTDKLLTNYFFLGLINLLFPRAQVIHTRRNPVDTCLSGFTKLFKDDMPHSYDLRELGRYYVKYDELMRHWEEVLPHGFMTTVSYEDVVTNTEQEARRLIEFLGLPWNQNCVEFHKSERPVKTASVAQVRQPIYTSSLERWKRYGEGLRPLLDAIEQGSAAITNA